MGREFIFNRLTNISGMGDVMVYDLIEDNGDFFEEGMISLDMKWLRPCTFGPDRLWRPLVIEGTLVKIANDEHNLPSKTLNEVDPLLINLLQTIIAEKYLLSESKEP